MPKNSLQHQSLRGFIVLLQKGIPQNHCLQTATQLVIGFSSPEADTFKF
jgi:hypothetical protein